LTINVISTPVLVLDRFMQKCTALNPGLKFVYDEQLSFETAITKLRADNETFDIVKDAFPLIAFKRTPLRWSGLGSGRRLHKLKTKGEIFDGTVELFSVLNGEMEIQFFYCHDEMHDMENFEVEYLVEENIASIKNIDVTLPGIGGVYEYSVIYNALDDLTVNYEGIDYKLYTSSAIVRGGFPVFKGTGKIILEINAQINTFLDVSKYRTEYKTVREFKVEPSS